MTVRLEGATMRHYMALPNQSWYTQVRPRIGGIVFWGRASYPGAIESQDNRQICPHPERSPQH